MTYLEWLERERIELKFDKCTMSIDWNIPCCDEHDWTCALARDPRDGYRRFCDGDPEYRVNAKEFSRAAADKRFWKCNREMVKKNRPNWFARRLGLLRTDFRYLGVRIGAIT